MGVFLVVLFFFSSSSGDKPRRSTCFNPFHDGEVSLRRLGWGVVGGGFGVGGGGWGCPRRERDRES